MKKILLELPDDLNKELKVYTAQNEFPNMKEAAINLIQEKLKGGKRTSKNEKD